MLPFYVPMGVHSFPLQRLFAKAVKSTTDLPLSTSWFMQVKYKQYYNDVCNHL